MFSPTDREIARAKQQVDAYNAALESGDGAGGQGQLVDAATCGFSSPCSIARPAASSEEAGPMLRDWLNSAAERGNALPGMRYRGKARDWTIVFVGDEDAVALRNEGGHFSTADATDACDVRFTASDDAWSKLASDVPPPGYQTLMGMVMTGQGQFEGDGLLFNQYAMTLEVMLGALPLPAVETVPDRPPRQRRWAAVIRVRGARAPDLLRGSRAGYPAALSAHGRRRTPVPGTVRGRGDHVRHRHLLRPADARQVRRSRRRPGRRHQLTTDGYVAIVMKMIEALGLDRPVVMGC